MLVGKLGGEPPENLGPLPDVEVGHDWRSQPTYSLPRPSPWHARQKKAQSRRIMVDLRQKAARAFSPPKALCGWEKLARDSYG